MPARLREQYKERIQAEMRTQFECPNVMCVPKLEKVVINVGVGDAIGDPRMMEVAVAELATISGQKPQIRKAKKSISNFKVRAGVNIACRVTLRGDRMFEFVDRLVNVAIPRIRDFRGVPARSFDAFGNYTLGLKDQTIFPEIDIDKITRPRGMNITFVIKNSRSAEESRELLRKLGMPFAN